MVKFRNQLFFLLSMTFLFGCSPKSDQELFESAKQNIQQNMFAEAVSDFESVLEEYPESQLAPNAAFEIGKIYQGQMIKNITRTQSFESAIKYYRMIVDNHPDDPNAPKSLFMIGFIQANELKRLEEAKETYKLFVEKYPDSELTYSAKAEIDNLGMEPEEILRHKMSKQ